MSKKAIVTTVVITSGLWYVVSDFLVKQTAKFHEVRVAQSYQFSVSDLGVFARGRWIGSDQARPKNAVEITYPAGAKELIMATAALDESGTPITLTLTTEFFTLVEATAHTIRAQRSNLSGSIAEIRIDRDEKRVYLIKTGPKGSQLSLFLGDFERL